MEWATTGSSDALGPSASSSSFSQYASSTNQPGMGKPFHTQANLRPPILRRVPSSNPTTSHNYTSHHLHPPPQPGATVNARSEPPGNVYTPTPSHFYGQYPGYDYPSGGQESFYGGGMRPMGAGPSGVASIHGNQNRDNAAAFGMSGAANVHPTEGVEMGLSSESGMDVGWLSFMRDCGIMDTTEGG